MSRARGKPILLYAPEVQHMLGINLDIEGIVTTQTEYECCGKYDELIDLLFLVSREAAVPEFVRLIQEEGPKNRFEFQFEHDLRKEYLILHCSAGEIMAFCLYWKMLMGMIHHLGGGGYNYPDCLDSLTGTGKPSTLVTWASCVKGCEVESTMLRYFNKVVEQAAENKKGNEHWQRATKICAGIEASINTLDFSEWNQTQDYARELGISTHQGDWSAFVRYITEVLEISISRDIPSGDQWGVFGRSFFMQVTELIQGDSSTGGHKLSDLLARLHRMVRFPLIAYTHMLLFDKDGNRSIKAKEHLAFPVWHSFDPSTLYPIRDGGEERSVMYCLYTIEPRDQWQKYSSQFGQGGDPCSWEAYKSDLGRTIDELSALVNPYVDRAYYSDEHKKNLQSILLEAKRAAISQVLARTLSHNLGSHSLNAFSGESAMLGQFQEIECRVRHKVPLPGRVCKQGTDTSGTQDASDDDQLPPDKSCIDVFKEYRPCNPQEEAAISRQRREWLATYNNYLRERMDLLADITTAVPAFEMPKQLVADLLEGYSRNVLLATTIAGTGGRFRYCWQPAGLIGEGKDVNVAIPSDILGAHAFYLILENIVRNSAKHGGHSEEVVFTVSVTEPTEPEWKKKGLLCVQITESRTDLKKNTSLVRERNASINAPVLDDKTRRVRDNGWGTLEMKAACAYLRRVALEELDEKKYQAPVPKEKDEEKGAKKDHEGDEPPLLKAIGNPAKNEHFGYEFYLMRPKLVMVCSDEGTDEAVIKTANLNQDGANSLQDHGIGAMTLDELEAITKGERKEVVNHALLVFLAKGEADLKRFIRAALMDLAALPHEMVVVGWDGNGADAFKELLPQAKEELLKQMNEKLTKAALDHNASILARSVVWVERSVWKELSNEPAKLYMEVRHRWMVGWMNRQRYSIDSVPDELEVYLKTCLKPKLNETKPLVKAKVNYAAHSNMSDQVKTFLGLTDSPNKNDDLAGAVLSKHHSGRRAVVQRYPSIMKRIMEPASDEMTWAQHHLVSWFQGIAVIDERIQLRAEQDHYQPEAKSVEITDPIPVKQLLVMGGVFVPPMVVSNDTPDNGEEQAKGVDLQQDVFSKGMWDVLVCWLKRLDVLVSYVCIHLTILEKFEKPTGKNVDQLLDEVRGQLPGIRIIMVSGRGKPPELPKTELFMSYSALSQYTTQTYQRAPVLLSMLSHNTRRIIS